VVENYSTFTQPCSREFPFELIEFYLKSNINVIVEELQELLQIFLFETVDFLILNESALSNLFYNFFKSRTSNPPFP
jgi:hypothetical protein